MPISGAWRVSYSMFSYVDSEEDNNAFITVNGVGVYESQLTAFSNSGAVGSTGGREETLEASAGDSITLWADRLEGDLALVLTCFDFLPTM